MKKRVIFAVVLSLVLTLLFLSLGSRRDALSPETAVSRVAELDPGKVSQISVTAGKDVQFSFVREEGKWWLTHPLRTLANERRVEAREARGHATFVKARRVTSTRPPTSRTWHEKARCLGVC